MSNADGGAEGRGPWIAYARTGPKHRSAKVPVDHATVDGRSTLCGLVEIGGSVPEAAFQVDSAFSCRRCRAVLATKVTRQESTHA